MAGMDIENRDSLIYGTLFSAWDFVVISIYFLSLIATGIYSSCAPNRNTVAGYFLAGRFMWWLPIGASLFVSNIGSEHFIGLAGSGAAAGISVGAFEFNSGFMLQLLGWIFLPVFIASGVSTLPEYMSKRFGGRRIQTCLAILSLCLYILTKISVNMFAGAIVLQSALRFTNLYISVSIIVFLTAFLTFFGGLAAVIYTDMAQFFVIMFGTIFVAIKAYVAVGGFGELHIKFLQAIPDTITANSTCGIPRADSWVLLREAGAIDSDMPWVGFIFGQTPASIWYWCADQMMVQRVLSARSLSHAQGATIFAGFVKFLPMFILVVPGMISRVLYPNEIGCVDPAVCQEFCGQNSCTNFAYPKLVFDSMPHGMKGLMLSVMMSALITDLTSIFNSSSTLFTMDIWSLIFPKTTQKQKVIIGRAFIIIMVVLSLMWIPIIERTQGGQLYIYIQSIAAYLSPPIAAVYVLAISWPRMNEKGAFYGLMVGFTIGIPRMILDFTYTQPSCGEIDTRPPVIKNFHYMYFAMLLFWCVILSGIIISLLTQKLPDWRLHRTTYSTRFSKSERPDDVGGVNDNELFPIANGETVAQSSPSTNMNGIKHLFLKILYGNEDSPESQIQQEAMNKRINKLKDLNQKTWEKVLLGIMLVVIFSVSIFFYIYFSMNPYTKKEVDEIQRQRIAEILRTRTNIYNTTIL